MKKITSLAIVLTLLLCSITTVFADDLDLINQVDDSKNFSWNEFVRVPTNLRYVGENIDDYLIEFKGQFYRAAQVQAAIDAGAENFEEAIKELEPVEKPIEGLEVVEVSAITDVKTKVTTVTATVLNAEEDAEATVAIFAYDEEGELVEEAVVPAFEAEIDEEGKIEVEVDAVEKELDSGDYKVVVTVTQVVDEEEVTAEGEFEFELDFTAVDAAVEKVNKATNQVLLWDALQNELFVDVVYENIDGYTNELLENEYDTVAEIQAVIDAVNRGQTFAALLAELKDAANQVERFNVLEREFDNVYAELMDNYQEKFADYEYAEKDDIQLDINEVNVDADIEALDLAKLNDLENLNEVTEDLTLPVAGKYGTTITWEVGENDYLTEEGKVTRPAFVVGDKTITLTATVAIGEEELEVKKQTFVSVTIKKLDAAKSIYAFEYEVPESIAAEDAVDVTVTFKTVEDLGEGYNGVRFVFEATGPEESTVTFKAKDTNGAEHTFVNEGVWGPAGGFNVTSYYEASTNWNVEFSEAGEYTITFSLIILETEEIVATDSVTVTVGKSVDVQAQEDADEFKEIYKDVLAISLVPGDEAQVVFEDLPAIKEALDAFENLSAEAKGKLSEEKSKLDQLEASAKDRYRIDINLINSPSRMSEYLQKLGNKYFNRLSDEQKEDVAQLLILDTTNGRPEVTDRDQVTGGFTSFDNIEPALNRIIVMYQGYMNAINKAEDVEDMKEALTPILALFNITGDEATLIATIVLEERPESGYSNIAEIKAAAEL